MIDEFKKFILKGNVIDLSTGVIIGAAFTGIVGAFTKGIVEPILALAGKGPSPDLKIPIVQKMVEVTEKGADGKDVTKMVSKLIELDLGIIIGAVISFLITAAVVFFVIVKPMNKLVAMANKPKDEAPAAPAEPSEDVKLLTEIRDLLKAK
ncbi:MAG: large conductance mechanosensitive channel protein MscL [Verrucomicrobiales bacterium]|nr:large conductance mechanosensitive channel protein MscL [Verrucomicrobiales bacterium]